MKVQTLSRAIKRRHDVLFHHTTDNNFIIASINCVRGLDALVDRWANLTLGHTRARTGGLQPTFRTGDTSSTSTTFNDSLNMGAFSSSRPSFPNPFSNSGTSNVVVIVVVGINLIRELQAFTFHRTDWTTRHRSVCFRWFWFGWCRRWGHRWIRSWFVSWIRRWSNCGTRRRSHRGLWTYSTTSTGSFTCQFL